MSKYFVINEAIENVSVEDIKTIEKKRNERLRSAYQKGRDTTKKRLTSETVGINHVYGRVIIKIDIDSKNTHTFSNGQSIYLGRQYNNLNRRETEPVNAIVVDAEYIPKGAEILIHPNSIVDGNRIFDYAEIGEEEGNSLRYYSIEEYSAFLYRMEGEDWKPLKGFITALRVFEPYRGNVAGIVPQQLKNILYITSGELKGKACHTLNGCDYEIIFQDRNGQGSRLIRARHYENEIHDREEITAISNEITSKINEGIYFIGITNSDCKTLK